MFSRKTKTEEKTEEVKTDAPQKPVGPPKSGQVKSAVTWQRIAVSMLGIAVLLGIWRWSVFHLYSLPPESLSSFTTITVNNQYAIMALVIFFVTGKLIYDLKVDTVSTIVTRGEHLFEKREEKRESHDTLEMIEHVVDEGSNGAPARRPFNPDESHDKEP